MRLNA
jgi:serine/threonine protein phosphatase PrpC